MSWRDELVDTVKSKAEREAEERARKEKRLREALVIADDALAQALDGLRFTHQQLQEHKQPVSLVEADGGTTLKLRELSLGVALSREDAVLKVTFNDGRPREFDFSNDRHLSPKDVEEYVGRRAIELARAAQKDAPW